MRTKISLIIILFFTTINSYCQKIINSEYDWSAKPEWEQKLSIQSETNKESYSFLKNYVLIDFVKGTDDSYYMYKTYHYIVYLSDDNAVDLYNKVYIPFNNGIDIINIKARTYNKNGKVVLFDKKNIKESDNIEDKGKYKLFALDGVEKGNMVEVFYTIKKPAEMYGYIILGKSVPSNDVFFQISTPKNIHFSFKENNGKGIGLDSVIGSKRFISLYYDSISAIKDEKYSNYDAARLKIDFKFKYNDLNNNSEYYTYDKAAQEIYEVIYRDWDDVKKKIKKIILELKIENLSTDEKIMKIENYVKNNYAINAYLEYDGVNKIENTLKNKTSEELGISILFALLYKAANIDYNLCFSTSRDNGTLDPNYMSWLYIESYLFYFPETDKYLSPVRFDYRYPMFPYMLMNNNAMQIKTISIGEISTALAEFKVLPTFKSSESKIIIDAKVHFEKDFSKTIVDMRHDLLGYSAIFIQPYYNLLDEAKQKEFMDSYFESISEDVWVKNFTVKNNNPDIAPLKDPFSIESTIDVSSLVERAGDNMLFKVGLLIGEQTQLYSDEKRKLDIDIYYPHQLLRTITVDIPENYQVKGLESTEFNYKMEGLLFESKSRIDDNKIIIEIKEEYNYLNYPLSAFESFRSIINAAADFNRSVIIFEKQK